MRNWLECTACCFARNALRLVCWRRFLKEKPMHICKYMYHVMDAAAALTEEIRVMKTLELKQ